MLNWKFVLALADLPPPDSGQMAQAAAAWVKEGDHVATAPRACYDVRIGSS
jgi:hypothetical protein